MSTDSGPKRQPKSDYWLSRLFQEVGAAEDADAARRLVMANLENINTLPSNREREFVVMLLNDAIRDHGTHCNKDT